MSYVESQKPDDLKSKTRAEVVSRLGVPERVVLEGDREYWRYSNRGGWQVYIPLVVPPVGIIKSKNLVLEFQGDKVTRYYLDKEGFSFGVCNVPGAVAN